MKQIAYIMSRFPKISETFILYEILELERLGLRVEIFPLVHHKESIKHPEAETLVERAHYNRIFSGELLMAQVYWLYKRPQAYLRTWWQTLRGNMSSWKFLVRTLVIVPKSALFARQMQALEIKHVHAHWATHPALAAYVIKQLTNLSYSFTAHAHDIYVERSLLEEKIQQASFVVTISEYNRRFLQNLYGAIADKTVIIHCGIDPDVFQPPSTKERTDQFIIICIGSLEEKKGHPYLIEACAELKVRGINFRCLLIGDGNDRPQIEAQITRLGLTDCVTLLGFQPRHSVSELLAKADVMVLPSVVTSHGKQEGIPVALMEALAMKLPAIATAISGVSELIQDGETGLLVPERDTQALAKALLKLYDDPDLGKRLGNAGRAKVLEEFNLRYNSVALSRLFNQDWANLAPTPKVALPASELLSKKEGGIR